MSKILVLIDKPTQQMKVLVDNLTRYVWDVSTGKELHRWTLPTNGWRDCRVV